MVDKTITVIVASLNEEANIAAVINNVLMAVNGKFDDYEIILFDDCSSDRTGEIIDNLAACNSKIKAIHNSRNMGFGYNFNKGVKLARMNYISILPGDNEIELKGIEEMFSRVGLVDIIVPYVVNKNVRTISRRLISKTYVLIMNMLFKCGLRYYTGPAIVRADILKKIPLKTNDFAFMSAILVRAIRRGHSFMEVPISICCRLGGKSKAFKIKNVISVFSTIMKLFWEIEISQGNEYNKFKKSINSSKILI